MSALNVALLEQARQYAGNGDARAEKAFALVLENDAFNVEARTFLARVAMQSAKPEIAIEHLSVALRVAPGKPALWRSMGLTRMALEQWPEATAAFEHCLQLAPVMHAARLHLGQCLERQHRHDEATKAYLQALSEAQRAGLWLDAASTPEWLADGIAHAITVANRGRQEIHEALMAPLRARFAANELQRVEQAVRGILGFETVHSPNPKQQPTFLYFPGLPDSPVFARELFPWFDALEASFTEIRAEADAVLVAKDGLSPFLALGENDRAADYLGGAQPAWDAFFFYRHGERYDAHHATCPQTSAALESLPLVRIVGHAPEICFSVLGAGSHILPHYGTSNIRSVVHLPLIVPKDCALKVLDTEIPGKAGSCSAFDDTYLHEAWNRSTAPRVILLMDTWNPHLTEIEKLAMAEVVAKTGHLNTPN
ncbi:aspartyl/asparaginyl beta-hydroxylase domain-containing protein [Arenimonas sp.]|jgi:aspartate beta-hydroxylase|uniref:aspartyl/asparaginyl beta-hydroxylase domain-containing protein n=1 Tax=Arenimonas sp. TaxID=1872635 RepID=UPI0037C05641